VKRPLKSRQHVDELIALRKQVADLKAEATLRKRVEDALRRSEARYRSLVERCPVALAEIDATGYLLFANGAFARRLGFSSKAEVLALGTGMAVFRDPGERDRALSLLRASAGDLRFETMIRLRSGESRPFDVTGCVAGSGAPQAGFILVLAEEGVGEAPRNGSASWQRTASDPG
jgi:PAS domain S-box-containing protein